MRTICGPLAPYCHGVTPNSEVDIETENEMPYSQFAIWLDVQDLSEVSMNHDRQI